MLHPNERICCLKLAYVSSVGLFTWGGLADTQEQLPGCRGDRGLLEILENVLIVKNR